MARVPYVQFEEAGPLLAAAYANTQRMNGRVSNFHRLLGHVPDAYPWYQGFQYTLQRAPGTSSLPLELRQLAHLATSEVNKCRYCAGHNAALATKIGIAQDKVDWLRSFADQEPDPAVFDRQEQAVIRWSRAVTLNQARRDMTLFAELEELFTPTQIAELTVVIAARTFTNLIQEALWTDLEEPGEELEVPPGVAPDERGEPMELLRRQAALIAAHLYPED